MILLCDAAGFWIIGWWFCCAAWFRLCLIAVLWFVVSANC